MKRLPEEDFEEYRERRKKLNKLRRFLGTFNFIPIKPKQKLKKIPYEPGNKAQGKRHENETLIHFRERRQACNQRRRERERKAA